MPGVWLIESRESKRAILRFHAIVVTVILSSMVSGCFVPKEVPVIHATGNVVWDGPRPPGQAFSCGVAPGNYVNYTERSIQVTDRVLPELPRSGDVIVHLDVGFRDPMAMGCGQGYGLYKISQGEEGQVAISGHNFTFEVPLSVDDNQVRLDGELIQFQEFARFPVNESHGPDYTGTITIDHAGSFLIADITEVESRDW